MLPEALRPGTARKLGLAEDERFEILDFGRSFENHSLTAGEHLTQLLVAHFLEHLIAFDYLNHGYPLLGFCPIESDGRVAPALLLVSYNSPARGRAVAARWLSCLMIDSHCHLDHCPDPYEAADPQLKAMITVGTTAERNGRAVSLAQELSNVWAAVGIHPNNASDASDPEVRAEVERLARHARVVAVGETGFDTHWEKETLESQRSAFDWHAQLAAALDLPLILHVRDRQGSDDASRAATEAIRAAGHPRGVLHCFNGDQELMTAGLELGWMVSFAGNLTYPSAQPLRVAAQRLPRERLMVETDSPFLAPVPQRGRKNTPAFVRHTAAKLAELLEMEAAELEALTDGNAIDFYRLPLQAAA